MKTTSALPLGTLYSAVDSYLLRFQSGTADLEVLPTHICPDTFLAMGIVRSSCPAAIAYIQSEAERRLAEKKSRQEKLDALVQDYHAGNVGEEEFEGQLCFLL